MTVGTLDVETGEPKYARIEYERRWVVDRRGRPRLDGFWMTIIEDRYIHDTRMRLRRMTRPDAGERKWKLTKKYECVDAAARPIVSTYLQETEYELLRGLPARELTKRRYHLPFCGRYWSLDIFEGSLQGLELVECEAEDALTLAGLAPPEWASREITHLPHWQCGALAVAGSIPEE